MMHPPANSLALLFAALATFASAAPSGLQKRCAFHEPDSDATPDLYIVKLKDGHTLDAHFSHIGSNLSDGSRMFNHFSLLNAYHAQLDEHTVHELIRFDPMVEYVEQDHYVTVPDHTDYPVPSENEYVQHSVNNSWPSPSPPGAHGLNRRFGPFTVTKESSLWWHAYITRGQTVNPNNKDFAADPWAYNFKGAGDGVDIYVLDSGVRLSHSWFQGRAQNFKGQSVSPYTGSPADDFDSHGTHVASIAARVAPGAAIINVKVTCKRTTDAANNEAHCQPGTGGGITKAIQDIATEHTKKVNSPPSGWKGSVINLSLSVQKGLLLAEAVKKATRDTGIPIATAAGNGNTDNVDAPCSYNKNTVCVGATDRYYKRSFISNFGERIGIFAPGETITAASITDDNHVIGKLGTSQATPMVAGAMAIYVGWENINSNVNAISNRLFDNALQGKIQGLDGKTVNRFLNTGINNPDKPELDPYNGIPAQPKKAKRVAAGNRAQVPRAGPTFKNPEPGLAPPITTTTDGSDEPAAPTGDPSQSFSVQPPTDAPVPSGYASMGEEDGNGPNASKVVTISWTAAMQTDAPEDTATAMDTFGDS